MPPSTLQSGRRTPRPLVAAWILCALAGCAGTRPQQAGPPRPLEALLAATPPKIELPNWEIPQVDLAQLSADKRVPSNDRDWVPELKVLAYAETDGDKVHIHNVRNAQFFSYRDCLVDYYDKTYDLSKIRTVDFIMIPFADNRAIAHTLLSFGFEGGDYVGVSAEVRLEKGESYGAGTGLFNQFELIYVVADERDLLPVRAEYRNVDVLLYRTKATPDMAKKLFVDVMQRVNQLKEQPEFYDTLSNNCTTNIVRHINTLAPDRIPHDYRVLLPGYADSLAYELGLIDTSRPFAEVRRNARTNDLILRYKDDPHFSQRIRGEAIVR
ncbi:MAG TPA: DUF4105 domain-containing protein [Pirellulaceae bacterium]|nr:DUF4105 domain-containing protein [Pirellulaceae bacterium]